MRGDAQTPGKGSDSTIEWNPNINGFADPGTSPDWEQPGSDIVLGHELVHSAHAAKGNDAGGPKDGYGGGLENEERNTVGLPGQKYNNPKDPLGPRDERQEPPGHRSLQLRREFAPGTITACVASTRPLRGSPPEIRPSYYPPEGKPPFPQGTPGGPYLMALPLVFSAAFRFYGPETGDRL